MTVPGEDQHAQLDAGWCLPPPAPREAVHTRSIVCRSFRRDDGLLDIDARFIDTRPFAYDSEFRGPCPPGSALHHMQIRLTVDRERRIQALASAMPGTPYSGCAEVDPTSSGFGLSVARLSQGAARHARRHGRLHPHAGTAGGHGRRRGAGLCLERHAPRRAGQAEPVRIWRLDALLEPAGRTAATDR